MVPVLHIDTLNIFVLNYSKFKAKYGRNHNKSYPEKHIFAPAAAILDAEDV